MASALVEETVEEIVEEVVEETVENAVEEAVEDAVEDAVEEAVEEQVEAAVEEAVENAVEDAVDEAVEEEVEEGVEQTVNNTIRNRIIKVVAGLLVAVLVISPIIDLIKAGAGAGKKKCTIDDKTKAKMDRSVGVLDVLSKLVTSWAELLKSYNQKESLGDVTYRGKSADAAGVVWGLFNDMKEELRKAQRISDACSTDCKWKANIDVFELDVIKAAYNIDAIFMAKDHGPVMKQKNFPPEDDRKTMTDAFNKFYNDDWKMIIKMNAQKNLTKAVKAGAAKAAQEAVKKEITPPLKTAIKSGIEKQVVPDVKGEAKSAADAETKIVFNEWNARINEHAAIPIYGISSLKHWMMDNIKPEAVRKSTEKATAAANATFQLPDAQIKIMHITADSKDQVLRKYRDDIKKIADKAADDYIKKALEEHKAKK